MIHKGYGVAQIRTKHAEPTIICRQLKLLLSGFKHFSGFASLKKNDADNLSN
jgi:hypothetical protein